MKALQTVLLGRVLPQNNLHNNNTAKSLEQERQEVRKVVLAVLAEMRDSLNSIKKRQQRLKKTLKKPQLRYR